MNVFLHPTQLGIDLCPVCASRLEENPAPCLYLLQKDGTLHAAYAVYFSLDREDFPDRFEELARQRRLTHLVLRTDRQTLCGAPVPFAGLRRFAAVHACFQWRPFAETLLSIEPRLAGLPLCKRTLAALDADLESIMVTAALTGSFPPRQNTPGGRRPQGTGKQRGGKR